MEIQQLQAALGEYFAPWVQDLHLEVMARDADKVTVRLPNTDRLARACAEAARPKP